MSEPAEKVTEWCVLRDRILLSNDHLLDPGLRYDPADSRLKDRKIHWNVTPWPWVKNFIGFLNVEDNVNLNNAVVSREDRPHLVKCYQNLRYSAFDDYGYTEKNDFMALEWAINQGILLRDFRVSIGGEERSGRVIIRLIEKQKIDLAIAYVLHGKLCDIDAAPVITGETALLHASRGNHLVLVEGLLAAAADVNKTSARKWTSLLWACYQGHAKVVALLLTAGADMDKKNIDGETPLYLAARRGHQEILSLLLKSGAKVDVPQKDGHTAIHVATRFGHTDIVKCLINAGAKLNWADHSRSTPLIYACHERQEDIVNALLAAEVDINHANDAGSTALAKACYHGHMGIVGALLGRYADVNKGHWSPLMIASGFGYVDPVKLLLAAGADVNMTDRFGYTALVWAAQEGQTETVTLLLEAGANKHVINCHGDTAAVAATKSGHNACAAVLLAFN